MKLPFGIKMFNVSLNKSTNIAYTFSLYFVAYLCLSFLGYYIFTNYGYLEDRFNDQTIFATHLFTIGFISLIFTGSFFQLLPVLFGIDLKINKTFIITFIISIILSLLAFFLGLVKGMFSENYFLLLPFLLLILSWSKLFVAVAMNFMTLHHKKIKDIHLITCLTHLLMGSSLGLLMIIGHAQLIQFNFRPYHTNLHVMILLIGFLLSLIYLIAKNVIPMFFVAETKHNYKWGLFLFYVSLYLKMFAMYSENIWINYASTQFLAIMIFSGCYDIIKTFRTRKRKRKNPVINLWYLGVLILTSSLILTFHKIDNIDSNFLLHKAFFVFVKIIISAMIVKIMPFLYWLNLSFTQQNLMRNDTKIPTVNDFFSEKEIKFVYFIQILTVLLATFFQKWLGIGLILESIYLISLFIKANNLFNLNIIKLKVEHEQRI